METLTEYRTDTSRCGQVKVVADAAEFILNRITTRQAVVAVIGLGYVGLPLAVAFAEAGFSVVGIDVDRRKVDSINAGQSYIADVPSERLAALVPAFARNGTHAAWNEKSNEMTHKDLSPLVTGSLRATHEYDVLCEVDAVIICVPTPLNDAKDPDISYIVAAADEIAPRLHPGMLIVLESTTYPGTTEEAVLPRLERSTLEVGTDFFLAFSPERIDPGRTDFTVSTTPKVIGGMTPRCLQVARTLYECAIERVVPVSSPKAAEMVKLLENTFRLVNIGLANELAIMCDRLGVNVWEVVDAAKTKPYGFMPFYPGPGLGGHCIPIDPLYLSWKMKSLNYNARFIQLAADINSAMPHYVLSKIMDALNEDSKALKGSRVLILGVTYKADISDMRESPALDLIHLLCEKGADVAYNDPFVPQLKMDGGIMSSTELTCSTLHGADCVVIATAHKNYDWAWVTVNSQLVVDTRNATRDVSAPPARVVTL